MGFANVETYADENGNIVSRRLLPSVDDFNDLPPPPPSPSPERDSTAGCYDEPPPGKDFETIPDSPPAPGEATGHEALMALNKARGTEQQRYTYEDDSYEDDSDEEGGEGGKAQNGDDGEVKDTGKDEVKPGRSNQGWDEASEDEEPHRFVETTDEEDEISARIREELKKTGGW